VRRVFLHISVSADGYINDEAGAIDWLSADDEFERHIDRLLESIDGMIFGRVSFEQLAAFWPDAGPDVTPTQVRRMHELPKYVLSSTLQHTEWHNSHTLGDDPATAIVRLKQQDGRDLALFAGASAATSLLALGVIDELRLLVHPTLLGGGTRLFSGRYPRCELRLTDTQRFASGALLVVYDVVVAGV
jgi:dihydrofolate reductase